jgi:hypothetical protein
MHRYIARANIDHYLDLLNSTDLSAEKRAILTKLLIEEEDKLSLDMEHLEFTERRAADGRERVKQFGIHARPLPLAHRSASSQIND